MASPRFAPATVSTELPADGPFCALVHVVTGESNENVCPAVPTTAWIETLIAAAPPVPAGPRQINDVVAFQEIVEHCVLPIVPVCEKSTDPKLKPAIVIASPPVWGRWTFQQTTLPARRT